MVAWPGMWRAEISARFVSGRRMRCSSAPCMAALKSKSRAL
ncbi:Uncharacterised protein [Bordetella pertussis]|nr:Uncharacterised protein [Bordetella pertussis]